MINPLRAGLAPLAACALMFGGSSAGAASYDCSGGSLTDTEQTICNDPQLSEMDSRMAALYEQVMTNSSEAFAEEQKQDQAEWQQERDACGTDTTCLTNAYTQRIDELEKFD